MKKTFDIGTYVPGKFVASENYKLTKHYVLWTSMLSRCKKRGNTVCKTWTDFQNFAEWADKQPNFDQKDFDLDKDLTIKNNNEYSESACSFVPRQLNSLVGKKRSSKGLYPTGVRKHESGFDARFRTGDGRRVHLGTYATPEEAFSIYKSAKESHIREQAERFKNCISPAVYEALLKYEISE